MSVPPSDTSDSVGTVHVQPVFYRPNAYSVEDSVGYLMKQIMLSVLAHADKRLGAHGLTHAQWMPLLRLRLTGESTVAELARWLQIDAGATTRLIDRLEKKGLCRRSRSTDDRRVVFVTITPEGLAATAEAPSALCDILNAHLAGFSESEWKRLVSLLRRMRDTGDALRDTL
jgi:DNA-binding MarR family transcriptional regulator